MNNPQDPTKLSNAQVDDLMIELKEARERKKEAYEALWKEVRAAGLLRIQVEKLGHVPAA